MKYDLLNVTHYLDQNSDIYAYYVNRCEKSSLTTLEKTCIPLIVHLTTLALRSIASWLRAAVDNNEPDIHTRIVARVNNLFLKLSHYLMAIC